MGYSKVGVVKFRCDFYMRGYCFMLDNDSKDDGIKSNQSQMDQFLFLRLYYQ